MNSQTIGMIIKSRREAMGLTQTQLAERLNITMASVGFYEQGVRIPGDEMLQKICEVLKIPKRYKELLALKHPELAAAFALSEFIATDESQHDEMISIARRKGLIPKKANQVALELIRSMGSREGSEFVNPEAAARAYKEALQRPEILLLEAFLQLPQEEQEDVIGIVKYKQSKLKKK